MNKVYVKDGMKPEKAIQLNGQHIMITKWIDILGPNDKVIITQFKKLPFASKRLPKGLKDAVKFYCQYFKENGNTDGALKELYGIDHLSADDFKDI